MRESIGYVDSASIWSVPAALSETKLEHIPDWTITAAGHTTALLASAPDFEVMPGPHSWTGPSGLYDTMAAELKLKGTLPTEEQDTGAVAELRGWIRSDVDRTREVLRETMADPSYSRWLDWTLRMAWLDHARMYRGLFGTRYINELALVLNKTVSELDEVRRLSQNEDMVSRWAENRDKTGEAKLAIEAYFLDSVLRGRYHASISRQRGKHLLHHPLRNRAFEGEVPHGKVELSMTEQYFASTLLAAPYAESKVSERAKMWAVNMGRVRRHPPVLVDYDRPRQSEDAAIKAAKRAGIELNSAFERAMFEAIGDVLMSLPTLWLCQHSAEVAAVTGSATVGVRAFVKSRTGKSPGEIVDEVLPPLKTSRLRKLARRFKGRLSTRAPLSGQAH